MDADERRIFTLEEARALLPELKRRIRSLRNLKRSMALKAPKVSALAERGRENAGSPVGTLYVHELLAFQKGIREFAETGCILRDLDRGLLDFPHRRGGRIVYLCWAWGEESIDWWHELDAGFAGRQQL